MPDPRLVATVKARGRRYTAWESVMVRRDFGMGISFFELLVAENSYGPRNSGLQLFPGDPVVIELGGRQVINGYVTTRQVAVDDRSHQVVIGGRSLPTDAEASSVPVKPGSYDGYTLEQVAKSTLAPHKVGVKVKNPSAIFGKPFPFLRINFGETVAELISRLAVLRGVFVSDDEHGNIVLGQGDPKAKPVAEIQEGRNVLRIVGGIEDQTAFSKYAAVSQTPDPAAAVEPRDHSAHLDDSSVRPNRVKLQIADHPAEPDELKAAVGVDAAHANWNRVTCTVTVAGWHKDNGELWQPAENVSVYSPSVFGPGGKAPGNLSIQATTFLQSSQEGTTTVLDMVLSQFLTSSPTAGAADTAAPGGGAPAPAPEPAKADPPDTVPV